MVLRKLILKTFIPFLCLEYVICYRGRDCRPLFSYALDPEAPEPCAVSSLVNLPKLQRVAVGLTNGRLFLVRSDISPTSSTMGEGSFVMTELGSSTVLHSLTAVFKDQGRSVVNLLIFGSTREIDLVIKLF